MFDCKRVLTDPGVNTEFVEHVGASSKFEACLGSSSLKCHDSIPTMVGRSLPLFGLNHSRRRKLLMSFGRYPVQNVPRPLGPPEIALVY